MAMSAPFAKASLRRLPNGLPPFRPVLVATDLCKGCGLCVDVCTPGALALDTRQVNAMGHHTVRLETPEVCTSCAKCARMCPDAALTIFARPKEA